MRRKILYFCMTCCIPVGLLMNTSCRKSAVEQLPGKDASSKTPRTELITDSIIVVNEVPSGSKEATRLQQGNPASDFTPTGFYLAPNDTLNVYVEQITGTRLPSVLIGTYSRYVNKWDPTTYKLQAGNNNITDQLGGLIYIRYNTDATPGASARITFRKGKKPVPYFVLGKTTHADWLNMLNQYTDVPDVQLVGKRVIIVASRAKALAYKDEDQQQVVTLADRIINIEDSLSGLGAPTERDRVNVHKYLMTETDKTDTYMAATWYRTWYHTNVTNVLLTVDGIRSWGPWHELGHMHQQGPMRWSTLGEVTVNIYSLAVERTFGITPSRLRKDGVWPKVETFLALPDTSRDYNGSKADVWVRLAMFHQLWLAFGDSFYHQIHQRIRDEKPTASTDADKMRYFMLTSSKLSGKNLSGFFRKWGFKVPASVYTEINNLNLPAPATDLTTLQD
ncbi:MAG TPA: M60 family metallopeptidase [Chitinophaga sp.]|uniref:M60 family metallopeptidase n=1 Tax=Chitinophaga sp. TaxID=1869181 RepID=UPI002BE9F668|nr:M60 family metallopeptidase [Chitinophaga sp.]HVI44243.1 M60 family metallopeptidase [Chitinophaga sp.]